MGSGSQTSSGSIRSRRASQSWKASPRFGGRAGQPVQRDRVPVVVQEQDGRLLNDHPGDVGEPEVGAAEEPPRAVQVKPVEGPALAEQVAQVAAPQVGEGEIPRSCTEAFVSLR